MFETATLDSMFRGMHWNQQAQVCGRQHLLSSSRRKQNIPRFRRSTYDTCGLSQSPALNSLPDSLSDPETTVQTALWLIS